MTPSCCSLRSVLTAHTSGWSSVLWVGLVLVLFPEPATSALGAGLFLLGLAWLAYEWNRP